MVPAALCVVLAAVSGLNSALPTVNVTAADGSLTVAVGADGIVGAWVSVGGGQSMIESLATGSGKTQLNPGNLREFSPSTCVEVAGSAAVRAAPGGFRAAITQQWSCMVPHSPPGNTSQVLLTVTDMIAPAPFSVTITSSVSATDPAAPNFTNALMTGLFFPTAQPARVWAPWGKGGTINDVSHRWGPISTAPGPHWQNPLLAEPLPVSHRFYRYGALGRNATDVISIPLISVLDPAADTAVSLVLSVDDPLLEVALEIFPNGVQFRRELLRLGGGRDVTFTAHIVGHRADWRPALNFMVKAFAAYFVSGVEDIETFEGLGGYTWNMSVLNASHGRRLGFKTNWDLSGTFMPYDGLFLPYQDEWENLGPINAGRARFFFFKKPSLEHPDGERQGITSI